MTTKGYLALFGVITILILIKVVFFSKKNIAPQQTEKLASS